MLKVYEKLEDVPEALREHYKLIEGRYVPEVSDDHPVKVNNVKLLNEKTAAETKASGLESVNTTLKADLESAKSHSLPRGHRAVPVAEVEANEKLKEHGTAAEIVTKLAEHKTLKEESAKRQTEDTRRAAAKDLGFNPDAFIALPNFPDLERKEKDGKPHWVAKVKDGETVIEKPASELVESSYAVFMPSLKAEQGVTVHGSSGASGTTPDPFKAAREFGENWNKSRPNTDVKAAFGIAN